MLEVKQSGDRPDLVNMGRSPRRTGWLVTRGRGGVAMRGRDQFLARMPIWKVAAVLDDSRQPVSAVYWQHGVLDARTLPLLTW